MSFLVIGLLVYNFETIKFYLFYREQCINSAIDAGSGERLGVCGRRVIDEGGSVPNITAIIYDSGDQILLSDKRRSPEWLKAAKKLGLRQEGIKESWLMQSGPTKSIMLDLFGDIIPLGRHFYRVNM